MPSIELSMIVKNGEATLARCLASARPIVDEIVIADTGSTDRSVEIARSFGARVVSIPWEDDFGKARNGAIAHGSCDWILSLDADEMLDAEALHQVRPLLEDADAFGYDVSIWNYVRTLTNRMFNRPATPNPQRVADAAAFPAYLEHVNVRLFRRHPEVRFEGRVHENVADGLRRSGRKVGRADFVIHHLGIAEEEEQRRKSKMEYYQELGRRKLADKPDDVRSHFELGLGELENFRNPSAALPYFLKAISMQPSWNMFWTYAGICLVRTGKLQDGLGALEKARQLGADDAVYFEATGDAHYHLDHFAEARDNYQAAKNAGSLSNLVESKLGVCELRLGSPESGLRRMKLAVEREPEFGELYDILMVGALLAQNADLATETAARRLEVGTPTANAYLITAGVYAQLGRWRQSLQALEAGAAAFPGDPNILGSIPEIRAQAEKAQA